MKPAIEIINLGKQYKLTNSAPYIALRDVISESARNIFSGKKKKQDSFWALRDVNLSIEPGERVGIIGRNGAGKSTLLKIISRITPPTTGEAFIRGRVGSLLEVGTGFHPELSGRENIYLNGSILGLKRAEITKQLEAIIDFSGVEKFIDTPLKHYSSGMQLRLAFSVAAHLEPEILLIDEVLAVGDMEFQKKCLGKMEEVSKKDGRTILFVSHNLDTIKKFCSSAILLGNGTTLYKGNTDKSITKYLTDHLQTIAEKNWDDTLYSYNKELKLTKASLHNETGVILSRFDTTQKIGISFEYQVLAGRPSFTRGINVFNQENVHIFSSHDVVSEFSNQENKVGVYRATVWIPGNLLPEGFFSISLALFNPSPHEILIHEFEALRFEVFTDYLKFSARGNFTENLPGFIRPLLVWEVSSN